MILKMVKIQDSVLNWSDMVETLRRFDTPPHKKIDDLIEFKVFMLYV